MKPTIKDVAKKANVSISTVSRVINQKGYVHEDTRVIIDKAIKDLGFVPNQLARSLTNRSSKIIAVIVPHIGPYFYGELLESIESQAQANGYKIMFFNVQDDPERELEYIKFFEQYNIEGIIIASNFQNASKLDEMKVPIITVDHILDENIPSITADSVKAGELAARRLIQGGSKNLAIFRGPSFLMTTKERTLGFKKEIKSHNIHAEIFDFDLVNPDAKLIEQVLRANPQIDGIFAYSDTLALVISSILKKLGRRIPEDVQIIGYDNTPFCSWINPPLTTIAQPISLLGKQAFLNLTRLIRGVELPTLHEVMDVELIERNSTK
ncbi:Degradation activator [Acholeplasma oculi]|uniref:LacI family transcription regulator n=1 Tax=Acholeplasma oculi TaxID=35623 RepID=A0A061AIG3_9MOLU|nr:LacI family DNA-binding transcriptional regulator [Acholeplasma oculi]CDR30742.1 LacI family transcription regulator [Acholeplasma oculi]SKC34816.1 transcriptional regulator, LacI family [Acholeplasma oculi]SUT89627.1 Degradation activator [Acholeplasma oculi]